MIDLEELKKKAEAAALSKSKLSLVAYDEETRVYFVDVDAFKFFDAANPKTILALIAELEALRHKVVQNWNVCL